MVDFICLDGPLKNKCLRGDFRRQVVDGVTYAKTTCGMWLEIAGHRYRVIFNAAYSKAATYVDWRQHKDHLVVEKFNADCPDVSLEAVVEGIELLNGGGLNG